MGKTNPVWIAVALAALGWFGLFTLISHVGGWAALAARYRAQEPFTGPRWSFQQAQMRWFVGYNHCITVGADPQGLYLSILFLFRIGHPAIFIPWREISWVPKKFLWVSYVELRLGRELGIPLRISQQLAMKLKSAAGTSWPVESVA